MPEPSALAVFQLGACCHEELAVLLVTHTPCSTAGSDHSAQQLCCRRALSTEHLQYWYSSLSPAGIKAEQQMPSEPSHHQVLHVQLLMEMQPEGWPE